jgi:hypothetical protein
MFTFKINRFYQTKGFQKTNLPTTQPQSYGVVDEEGQLENATMKPPRGFCASVEASLYVDTPEDIQKVKTFIVLPH